MMAKYELLRRELSEAIKNAKLRVIYWLNPMTPQVKERIVRDIHEITEEESNGRLEDPDSHPLQPHNDITGEINL